MNVLIGRLSNGLWYLRWVFLCSLETQLENSVLSSVIMPLHVITEFTFLLRVLHFSLQQNGLGDLSLKWSHIYISKCFSCIKSKSKYFSSNFPFLWILVSNSSRSMFASWERFPRFFTKIKCQHFLSSCQLTKHNINLKSRISLKISWLKISLTIV